LADTNKKQTGQDNIGITNDKTQKYTKQMV